MQAAGEIYNISIKRQEDSLLLIADPVDHTVLVLEPIGEAVTAANKLGAKRFMFAKNAAGLDEKAQNFGRDLVLDLDHLSETEDIVAKQGLIFYVGHEQLESYIQRYYPSEPHLFYRDLNEKVFPLADFSEPKHQEEFQVGGEEDKFARFNGSHVVPIIISNAEGQLLGCIRVLAARGKMAYLSDEIIAIPGLDKNSEAHRHYLGALFNQVRICLKEYKIETAFIRAAEGRKEQYQALGCQSSEDLYVIHGPVAELADYKVAALEAAKKYLAQLAMAAKEQQVERPMQDGSLTFLSTVREEDTRTSAFSHEV